MTDRPLKTGDLFTIANGREDPEQVYEVLDVHDGDCVRYERRNRPDDPTIFMSSMHWLWGVAVLVEEVDV